MRVRWAVAAGLALVAGCSMPLHVSRVVDPGVETRGVRFLVKRPALEAALRLEEGEHGESPCRFLLFLTPTLAGPPIEYEAVGESRLATATDVSLREDARGALTAVSAGELDRAHEALAAAAGFAVSFLAAPAAAGLQAPPCAPPSDDGGRLAAYVAEHRTLAQRLAGARSALDARLAAVGPRTGSGSLRVIDALRELVDTLEGELAAHRLRLDAGQIHVYVGPRPVQPTRPSGTPWLKVVLMPEEPA